VKSDEWHAVERDAVIIAGAYLYEGSLDMVYCRIQVCTDAHNDVFMPR